MFSRKIISKRERGRREATAGGLSSGGCSVLTCAGGAQVINRLTDSDNPH